MARQYPGENDGSVGPDTVRGVPSEQARKIYHPLYGDGEPILQNGVTRELLPDGADAEYRSPEELKSMGMPDNYTHTFIRDPERWLTLGEPSNRASEWKRATPGGYIPLDQNSQPHRDGDLIIAFYPRELKEQREEQQRRDTEEYLTRTATEKTGRFPEVEGNYWNDDVDRVTLRDEQHRQNEVMGLIGGQFSGLKWETVYREKGKEWFEAEQARYRSNNRHHTDVETKAQAERIQAAKDATTARGAGGKFVSIPANVRPKNFQKVK